MASIDVFKADGFTMLELIEALDKVDFKPQFLGQIGLFEDTFLRGTDTTMIEKRDTVLSVIPVSERGAPPEELANRKRDIRSVPNYRIYHHDTLKASEIFNIRAFGEESEFVQVQQETLERLTRIRDNIELTWEHMRLGAIQGILTDADESTLIDWFQFWGISQPAEIDFSLDGSPTVNVRETCHSVARAMKRASKGAWIENVTQVHALTGDSFYDQLIEHEQVKRTFEHWEAAQALRQGVAFEAFEYGGITWHNYRGTDDNSTVAVPTDKAKFFPVAARETFKVSWAPGEDFGSIGMPGRPIFPMIVPDEKRNQFVELEEYSYPLFMCLRPEMLQRGTA